MIEPLAPRSGRTLGEGDEYAALDLKPGWHQLSLLCFLAALFARQWLRLLPIPSLPLDFARGSILGFLLWRPFLPGFVCIVLATAGLLFGLLGRRGATGAGAARWGVWLNTIVLVLAGLFVLASLAIRYG